MEFLVFLLLGFAAVLLVIPSLIRGRLEESPVATADYFQKSMSELGRSLNMGDPRRDSRINITRRGMPTSTPRYGTASHEGSLVMRHRDHRAAGRPKRTSKAEIRRNRIMATLLLNSLLWGSLALFTTEFWALVLFTLASSMFALYWLAVISLTNPSYRRDRIEKSHSEVFAETLEKEKDASVQLP